MALTLPGDTHHHQEHSTKNYSSLLYRTSSYMHVPAEDENMSCMRTRSIPNGGLRSTCRDNWNELSDTESEAEENTLLLLYPAPKDW